MEDHALLRLMKAEPEKGAEQFMAQYAGLVYSIVSGRTGSTASQEDIEECVSDIFADIFFGYDVNSEFEGDMKGYISTVAKRRAINAYHSLTARAGHMSGEADEYLDSVSSGTDIEADHDREEARTVLLAGIKDLGEPDSTIILQKYYYDRTSEEIAKLLSMKASAVRMRAARALEKLKKSLAAAGITL